MSNALPDWMGTAWMQRGLDALRATLDRSPSAKREMIQFLFDAGFWDASKLTWPAAQAKFANCLNPARQDVHFKLAELWALMKRFGYHDLFYALCDDLGYERPRPLATEQRRLHLLERTEALLQHALHQAELARAELEALDVEPRGMRVTPGLHDGGMFSAPDPDDTSGPAGAF